MFKSATLVPTHPTSPWRGQRQLSLSSVSRAKVEGKQLRLAFSAQRLTLWLLLSSTSPPSSKCCPSLAHSLKQLPGRALLCFLPKLTAAAEPPALYSTLALIRHAAPAGLPSDVQMTVAVSLPACLVISSQRTEARTHPRCLSLSIPANESGAPWLH